MTEAQVYEFVMGVIAVAALVGIWNNWVLYDENMYPFRVGFFRFWFTLLTNPVGTLNGNALRKHKK